jgi:uncharacterized protein
LNDIVLPTDSDLNQPVGPSAPETRKRRPWHYAYAVALASLIVLLSFLGADQQAPLAHQHGRFLFYSVTIGSELVILGLAYLGMRFAGMTLPEVIGGRWNTVEDILLDVAIGFGFFIFLLITVASLALAFHLNRPGNLDQGKQVIQAIAPRSGTELAVFLCLSIVAGLVEEVVFRGYLQKEFGNLARSAWIGMFVSAALFGLSHGYEGKQRMVIIFVLGALFGTLTILRRSLRPGMIAHAAFDGFVGAAAMLGDKLVKSGAIK